MRPRSVVLIVAFPLLVGGLWWWARRPPGETAPTTVTAERGTLTETVTVTGKAVAAREVGIKSKASGAVLRLHVEESDRVAAGALLLELDPEDERRSVRRAELAETAARARLEQARANLAVAEADLAAERRRAESALTAATAAATDAAERAGRSEALLAQGLVSAEEAARERSSAAAAADTLASAQQRVADLATRERALAVRRQDVALAENELESAIVALKDARQREEDTRITAPMAGIVAGIEVEPGQIVSSGISTVGGGTTVMTIVDGDRLEVVANVDESDLGKLRVGQAAEISATALPGRRWNATVRRLGVKGEARNNTVDYPIRLALGADAAQSLRPEMTVRVAITTATATDAVLVPIGALTWRRDDAFAIRGDGSEVGVVTGASDGEKVEIVRGLAAGDVLRLPPGGGRSRWRREMGEHP